MHNACYAHECMCGKYRSVVVASIPERGGLLGSNVMITAVVSSCQVTVVLRKSSSEITWPSNLLASSGITYNVIFTCPHFLSVQILINHPKTDLNLKSDGGITPLMAAVKVANQYMLKLLIKKNADIAASDNDGRTALHWAAMLGNLQALKLIIRCGPEMIKDARDHKVCFVSISLSLLSFDFLGPPFLSLPPHFLLSVFSSFLSQLLPLILHA